MFLSKAEREEKRRRLEATTENTNQNSSAVDDPNNIESVIKEADPVPPKKSSNFFSIFQKPSIRKQQLYFPPRF